MLTNEIIDIIIIVLIFVIFISFQDIKSILNFDSLILFWIYNFEISVLSITIYNLSNRVKSILSNNISYFLAWNTFIWS